jgi:hypothetical protein
MRSTVHHHLLILPQNIKLTVTKLLLIVILPNTSMSPPTTHPKKKLFKLHSISHRKLSKPTTAFQHFIKPFSPRLISLHPPSINRNNSLIILFLFLHSYVMVLQVLPYQIVVDFQHCFVHIHQPPFIIQLELS